jgi:hypothetical protein
MNSFEFVPDCKGLGMKLLTLFAADISAIGLYIGALNGRV